MNDKADVQAIQASYARYQRALLSGDEDGIFAEWADDMVWMRSNEPEAHGKEACRKIFRASMGATQVLAYDPTTTELLVLGDWAIQRLTCTEVVRIASSPNPVTWDVKAIVIWQRQSDGAWKFARAITNANSINGREGYVYVDHKMANELVV